MKLEQSYIELSVKSSEHKLVFSKAFSYDLQGIKKLRVCLDFIDREFLREIRK